MASIPFGSAWFLCSCAFFTSGIAIPIYFVLAIIMPSDEDEEEDEDELPSIAAATTGAVQTDSAAWREFSMDVVRIFVSLLFAIGVGCLAGGLAVMLLRWSNDAVYFIGPAAGTFTASVAIMLMTRSGHPVVGLSPCCCSLLGSG